MFISRSAATAVATHNVLTTGVHGVAAKYLAISSGNDQLITNADVKAAAGIVYSKLALDGNVKNADVKADAAIAYSKLNLALGVVHGDVAAANKDGEAATPSMRTLGEGAAQAAAGNHTHTLTEVQEIAPTGSYRQNWAVAWEDISTGTIPANAKSVFAYACMFVQQIGNYSCQILYNSVQKAVASGGTQYWPYGCQWGGDGIGSEAAITLQGKRVGAAAQATSISGAWYVTI